MNKIITFTLGGINFEYDEEKNNRNIQKHGISFKQAARVFFDYDRIELYDEEHSIDEDILKGFIKTEMVLLLALHD